MPVVDNVSRGRRFQRRALRDLPHNNSLQPIEKFFAGSGNGRVFLRTPCDGLLQRWIALDEARKRYVFPRVMKAVWVVPQVVND